MSSKSVFELGVNKEKRMSDGKQKLGMPKLCRTKLKIIKISIEQPTKACRTKVVLNVP